MSIGRWTGLRTALKGGEMVTKRGKKPTSKVKNLPAKSLTAAQAKRVKGGLNPQPLPPKYK